MKLLTGTIRRQLPPLGSQEKAKDPVAYVKFFDPCGSWTWYVFEFDGKNTFYGLVYGFEKEWGYFSLSELEEMKNPVGLGIERDLYFKPTPLSQIKDPCGYHP